MEDTSRNMAKSLGFALIDPGTKKITYSPLREFYEKTLDNAIMDIQSGAFAYSEVLKRTINKMTASGVRWIDYESGVHNRVDVAARRAVLTGFRQVQGKINEQVAAELKTDYYEVTWHGGARPEHQKWQGKVYTMRELRTVCGLGAVTGLKGANCYHDYRPFIPGVSTRTYTDEQLKQMNAVENRKKTYNGREYTTYEALQQQRKMETAMRKYRQDIKLLKEGGADEEEIILKKARYQGAMQTYKDFSKKMGLPEQKQRIMQDGLTGSFMPTKAEQKKLEKKSASDTIISGARITDIFSEEAGKFAKMYYPEIRSFSTDVKKIAKNIQKSVSEIKKIKEYLFEDDSYIDPDTGKKRKFDPDCAIAQSWQRLMIGKDIKPHDKILIEHELLEMRIKEENPTMEHWKAHEIASRKYNYQKGVEEYYGNLEKHKKNKK